MKRMLAIMLMGAWCVLAIWLQIHYLRPGMTLGEGCIVAICVVPFYVVLFVASLRNIRKNRRKHSD